MHGGLVGQEWSRSTSLEVWTGSDTSGSPASAGVPISGDDAPIPPGTRVLVTAVQGTTLIVWPVGDPLPPDWQLEAGETRPGEGRGGAVVIAAISVPGVIGLVIVALVVVVLVLALRQMVNIVQQGEVGVVKHLGEYRKTHEPGLVIIAPFIETLQRVDMREIPRPGDRQDVITKDNVVVNVNATIFTQVVDAQQALFSIANFDVAIDALARTALRSVIGTMTLDQALSERERINTDVQQQMEAVTDKWGIRINRIEILAISPPPNILEALALEKQADQEKRARILQSEGQKQSAINVADGDAQATVRKADGDRQAAILSSRGEPPGRDPRGRGPLAGHLHGVRGHQKRRPRPHTGGDPPARRPWPSSPRATTPRSSCRSRAPDSGAAQTLRSVLAAAPEDGDQP